MLDHAKVQPLTPQIAKEIRLESSFVEFVFAKNRPECFRYWCENPRSGWTCYIPDWVDVAYPLWSTNADQTLVLVSDSHLSFAMGWHDNPEINMISETSQGLLVSVLNAIFESAVSEEELSEAARFSGFRFLGDLYDFANKTIPENSSWSDEFSKLIAEIDQKASQS